jgi:hypothetical protein
MTFENSYDIFKMDLEGEEFDSDDDALLSGNIAYREILNDRDWKFLKKTYTLPGLDLSVIPDLDKVLKVWCNGTELKKASFDNRFDTSKDYWVDYANKMIVPINCDISDLIVDYTFKPDDLESDTVPPKDDLICIMIAYKMELNYLRKDQDLATYQTIEDNYKRFLGLLINYNESL